MVMISTHIQNNSSTVSCANGRNPTISCVMVKYFFVLIKAYKAILNNEFEINSNFNKL